MIQIDSIDQSVGIEIHDKLLKQVYEYAYYNDWKEYILVDWGFHQFLMTYLKGNYFGVKKKNKNHSNDSMIANTCKNLPGTKNVQRK